MPTAIAALTEAFSRNMILNAFRSSVWLSVMTRGWEPDAQDNRTVHIPNLTVPAAAIDNPGRTGDGSVAKPPTFASPSTTLTDLIMDQIVRSAIELEKLDALENAMKDGEYERRVSEQLGQMMALNIDANFGTAITGANFAAAQKISTGDAGNVYIPRGNPLGYGNAQSATNRAASDELFMNSILLGLLNLTRANAIGRNFTVGPGEVSPVFWVGPPELTARFVQFLTKNSASGFSRDVLASSVQDSAGILSNMQFEGRWQNVDIMSTNSIAVPTGSGNWQAYMGVANAWAAALRPEATSISRYEDGNTGGAYVDQFTNVAVFGRKQLKAAWILELTYHAD